MATQGKTGGGVSCSLCGSAWHTGKSTDRDVTKRILVVDDRNDLLHLMRRVLEDEEYQVSLLQEGKDAFERVKTTLPDLLILDLKLGETAGHDILKQIRGDAITADVPVIIYTAAVLEVEELARSMQARPQYYHSVYLIKKPFELENLLATVERLLDKAVR